MRISNTLLCFIMLVFISSCSIFSSTKVTCKSEKVDHTPFNLLLSKHVTPDGVVDYKGFIADSVQFNSYITTLEKNHPLDEWTDNEELAYWINAYNAFTIRLIIRNYPVNSIKDLGGSIYKINTPWDIKFIQICNQTYELNNIESQKIRGQFDEPRIHFAVNCASVSCPKILNEAFMPETLNAQLDKAASEFINNSKKNELTSSSAKLSKIFSWYSGDFKSSGLSVIEYINQYSDVKLNNDADISYMDYNWNLNEVQ